VIKQALIESGERLKVLADANALSDFAVIGAFALARVAVPRATADVDYIIKTGTATLEELASTLGGEVRRGDISDPLLGVVSFSIKTDSAEIPIQLIQFPKAWEDMAFEEIDLQVVDDIEQRFVTWQTLLLLKLYAGSALDLQDAADILTQVDPSRSELEQLEQLAVRLRVAKRLEKLR